MKLTNIQKLIILLVALALLAAVVVICIVNGQVGLQDPTQPTPTGNVTDPVGTDPSGTEPVDPSEELPTSENVGIWPDDTEPQGSDPSDPSDPEGSVGVDIWDGTDPTETDPTEPQATDPKPTEPEPTEPKPTDPAPSGELTWEEYNAMLPKEQEAYFKTFANHQDFFAWYNKAKAEYEASTVPPSEIDGNIDLGEIINGNG